MKESHHAFSALKHSSPCSSFAPQVLHSQSVNSSLFFLNKRNFPNTIIICLIVAFLFKFICKGRTYSSQFADAHGLPEETAIILAHFGFWFCNPFPSVYQLFTKELGTGSPRGGAATPPATAHVHLLLSSFPGPLETSKKMLFWGDTALSALLWSLFT